MEDPLADGPEGSVGTALTQRRNLVHRVHRLGTAAMLTTVDGERMRRAERLLDEAAALLEGSVRTGRYDGVDGFRPGVAPSNDALWETHAVFGSSNPFSPVLAIDEAPGRLRGEVIFSSAYEGGPGLVFGGFLAALFDGVLGRTVLSSGVLPVTRSLSVEFTLPTPLRRPLDIRADVVHVEGRRVEAEAALTLEGTTTCSASGVFVGVKESHYRQ